MKLVFIITSLLLSVVGYSQNHTLEQVKKKMIQDEGAYFQFRHLSYLHCLDRRLGNKNELFMSEWLDLFNNEVI